MAFRNLVACLLATRSAALGLRPQRARLQGLRSTSAGLRSLRGQTETILGSQAAPVAFERADDASRVARRIETVLSRRTSKVIVVLERLVDGHNYSAIFRTCEALGVQHVWIVGPPEERFASRRSLTRAGQLERAERGERADANRLETDSPLTPGSRKARKRERARRAWKADADLDADHAAHGRGAARFLTVRDFDDAAALRAALDGVPDCELWCSDLGQGASVLQKGAPWISSETLPARVALCFGTESTGVSSELLEACDRRVYVPQHGFSDSLNVGVAAALALTEVLDLLGAGGDLVGDDAWAPDDAAPARLRAKWAASLARDDASLAAILASLGGDLAVLDDLRRPDEFRKHTGRPNRPTRRATANRRAAASAQERSHHP